MIRRLDKQGRVVIPKEIRERLNINNGNELEIWVNGKEICLQEPEEKRCFRCEELDSEMIELAKMIQDSGIDRNKIRRWTRIVTE